MTEKLTGFLDVDQESAGHGKWVVWKIAGTFVSAAEHQIEIVTVRLLLGWVDPALTGSQSGAIAGH